jgi:hypothetical protein
MGFAEWFEKNRMQVSLVDFLQMPIRETSFYQLGKEFKDRGVWLFIQALQGVGLTHYQTIADLVHGINPVEYVMEHMRLRRK